MTPDWRRRSQCNRARQYWDCPHLLRRAKDQLRNGNQPSALEQLDRILAIDGANPQVAEILAGLGKRRRARTIALAVIGVAAAGGGAWALRRAITGGGQGAAPPDAAIVAIVVPDAAPVIVTPPDATPVVIVPPDADEGSGTGTGTGHVNHVKPDAGVPVVKPDGGVPAATATVHLRVSPADSEIRIGDGAWAAVPGGRTDVTVPSAGVLVSVRNDCCEAEDRKLGLADAGDVAISLGLLPARVTTSCPGHEVDVRIDGKVAKLGAMRLIAFGETTQTEKVIEVEFVDKVTKKIDTQQQTVRYAKPYEVTCNLD